jgi:coenzyme F420-reducing hydrogenase gamma subunit
MPPAPIALERRPGSGAARTELRTRPRIGIVKFASCDGCQLTLLDLEDELLAIAARVDLIEFAEATSRRSPGPYDVLFVEGAVSTPEQADEIVRLRGVTSVLVTIGACATGGGIQALRNWADHDMVRALVYPDPSVVESLPRATPIADHVAVDAELRGCPISPHQLREFVTALVVGRRVQLPDESVCEACKRRGTVCIAVARGITCLGPVTKAGCGAICPAYGRGCYGCFGPVEGANTRSLASYLARDASADGGTDVARAFATFNAWAPAFRTVIDEAGGPPGPIDGDRDEVDRAHR